MNGTMHYFKKLIPHTDVVMSNNQGLKFTTLDSVYGYYATTNDFVIGELKQCVEQNRYSVCEISCEEFERDYLIKKNNGSKPARPPQAWERERIGSKGYESPTHPLPKPEVATVAPSVVVVDKVSEELRIEQPPADAPTTGQVAAPKGPAPTPALGSRSRPPIKPI